MIEKYIYIKYKVFIKLTDILSKAFMITCLFVTSNVEFRNANLQ